MVYALIALTHLAARDDPFYWYLTRDLAIAAYLTLTLSVLLGLVVSLARVTGDRVMWQIRELHYTLATLTGVLVAGHMLTLALDPYLPFSVTNLLLPLDQPMSPLTVDLGVLGFYSLVALLLTSWLRKRLTYTQWRAIHYVSFTTFVLVTFHGWLTGSDSREYWMKSIYFGCALAVGSLVATRLFISPQPQRAKRPRTLPLSLLMSLLMGLAGTAVMYMVALQ
jgi:predicted ferric reductase